MEKNIIEEQLCRMEEEAVREMLHYYEKRGKQKIKELIKRAAGRYVPPKDLIFWPTALIANSLTEWGLEDRFLPDVKNYFDRWIKAGMPIYFVDDVLAGVSLIDLYKKTKEDKYKKGADKLADYLFGLERKEGDEKGLIPYRPSQKNGHIYADGIGMICSFLIKYGVEFENIHGVELGLRHMGSMLDLGMDGKTGLPYHGFRYADGTKYGIIGWGRAVGWIFMSVARSLSCLESYLAGYMTDSTKEKTEAGETGEREESGEFLERCKKAYGELDKAFWELFHTIEPYQKQNGSFGWQLEAMEGPEDSSATAMIAYGVVMRLDGQGMANGVGRAGGAGKQEVAGSLPESLEVVRNPAQRAAEYLLSCEKNGKIYQCSAECKGFSEYPQLYGAYPWSLGPGLGVLRWYGMNFCG